MVVVYMQISAYTSVMSNKLAVYDNPDVLRVVAGWFERKHQNSFPGASLYDMYQSYSEYTLSPRLVYQRMDVSSFAKCLVACKIIDVNGGWSYEPDYTPKRYEITRATA